MALSSDIGNIANPTGRQVEAASNAGEMRALGQMFSAGTQIFSGVMSHKLESDIDDLFSSALEEEGLTPQSDLDAEIRSSSAYGKEAVATSNESPLIQRMHEEVNGMRRAVSQGVRSAAWYRAQVDRLAAEYSDVAPGLAPHFARIANAALDRNINSEAIMAKIAEEEAYAKAREELITQGEKYDIPRVLWETDPVQALADLKLVAMHKQNAAIASAALEELKARNELSAINDERILRQIMPEQRDFVTRFVREEIGLRGEITEANLAELLARGGVDAAEVAMKWELHKERMYNQFSYLPRAKFDEMYEPLDRQVTMALGVISGEVQLDAYKRYSDYTKALSDDLLYGTDEGRRVLAVANVLSKLPDSIATTVISLRSVPHMTPFVTKLLTNTGVDLHRTSDRNSTDPAETPKAIEGVLTAAREAPGIEGLTDEDRKAMGDTVYELFEEIAVNPRRVHLANWDKVIASVNNDKFWEAVDTYDQATRESIYNNFNAAMHDRAYAKDLAAIAEFSEATFNDRGILSDSGIPANEYITIQPGYPPQAVVRETDFINRVPGARAAAERIKNKFNKDIASRLIAASEAYAKFRQRSDRNPEYTPARAFSELYGASVFIQFARDEELDNEAIQNWMDQQDHQKLRELASDKSRLIAYMKENNAPEALLHIMGVME